jgi:hypothetical protein
MVAESRMFSMGAGSRGRWLLGQLEAGALGDAVIAMAEDLSRVAAAIDLALAEDEIAQLDNAALDDLIDDLFTEPLT